MGEVSPHHVVSVFSVGCTITFQGKGVVTGEATKAMGRIKEKGRGAKRDGK